VLDFDPEQPVELGLFGRDDKLLLVDPGTKAFQVRLHNGISFG
jgi:hypothetical protein